MTSSLPAPGELVRPLADLSAWTAYFRGAEIPVLRETVEALDALRIPRVHVEGVSPGVPARDRIRLQVRGGQRHRLVVRSGPSSVQSRLEKHHGRIRSVS